MKRTLQMLCALLAVSAVSLAAQTSQVERKSTVKVKDGESVKVTGCIAPVAGGQGFLLTNVADKTGALNDYILVSDEVDLSKHIGHRVQIEGKATDNKDGKVEMETKTRTKVEGGDDRETKRKSEVQGESRYLGVHSLKMIAAACP
jgi:uncharacterized protein (AIM24 family)